MSTKHFFFIENHQGTSNLHSRTGHEAITVTPNFPGKPDRQEVFLGISMDWSGAKPGEAWAAVDADELRDAIDKAVGKREPASLDDDESIRQRLEAWGAIVDHPFFEKVFGRLDAEGSLLDGMVKRLDRAEVRPSEGHLHTYPAKDRDRHLRHIEDVEATLTRRNERHEQDQERIRELEAEVARLEAEVFHDYTARECLELAWEAAIVPEDGEIHEGEAFLCKDESGIRQPVLGNAPHAIPASHLGVERRLLEPRVEPSKEDSYRKELESKGLAEWEIELLVGSAA